MPYAAAGKSPEADTYLSRFSGKKGELFAEHDGAGTDVPVRQ